MSHERALRAVIATLTLVVGCTEDPTGQPGLGAGPAAVDLDLTWPTVTLDTRTPSDVVELESAARPAGVLTESPDEDGPPKDAEAMIFGPLTQVGFAPTYAYSTGRHSYIGNVGRVETEARVTFAGQTIGVQPAERQNYVAFLLDWGEVKSIWAEAYVFTDQQCGLRVTGDSHHQAWWQWFLGGPAPTWGMATASSQAFPPAEQPPCEDDLLADYDEAASDGGGGGGTGGGAVTCWYWVTYDPYTGEVYDAELLYCDNVEGG